MDTAFSIGLPRRSGIPADADWLPAAREGAPWALERFYDDHQAMVFALCHRLLGRSDDAEDATQATFVRAFRQLPRFRGDSSVRTWVYRIAVNEALGMLRRRRESAGVELDGPPCEEEIPGIDRLAVRTALARVELRHRTILVLRYWEGLSCDEIAAVLRLSPPAVKMRLVRARREFRRRFEEGQ